MNTSAQLKALQSEASSLNAEIKTIHQAIAAQQQRVSNAKKRLATVQQQIKSLSDRSGPLMVSEHALLRYAERVLGIDWSAIQTEILSGRIPEFAEKLGNGEYPQAVCGRQYKVVIRDRTVTTIVSYEPENSVAGS